MKPFLLYTLRLVCLVAFVAGPFGVVLAQTATSQLDLDTAQRLLAEGKAQAAFDLLAPFEDDFAGDFQYDYLLARSALEIGQPSLASFIYERILAVEPGYVGVRLENGRAYLELQNFARAKQEFDLVLGFENLPPDLKAIAEQYVAIAQAGLEPKRTFFDVFGEYGFGFDDNVNSGISDDVLFFPGFSDPAAISDSSKRREDFYHAFNVGAEITYSLTDNWQLLGGADYQSRLHATAKNDDFHELNARAGIGYVTGTSSTRVFGRVSRFYFDDDHLRNTAGLSVDWLRVLNPTAQFGASWSFTDFRHIGETAQVEDYDAHGLSASINHSLLDGKALIGAGVNIGYEVEEGGRLDGDKVLAGLSVNAQYTVSPTIGVFAVVGYQRDNYQSRNEVFLVQRHDRIVFASAGVSWTFAKGWSLRPQANWTHVNSNVESNDTDRIDLSLNIRRDI
jgi:tetratricopeptide (TPR) repeat protein